MSVLRSVLMALLVTISVVARAETAIDSGVGLEYSQGDYGTAETSSQWLLSLNAGLRTGPWLFDVVVPFLSADGTVNRETGAVGTGNGGAGNGGSGPGAGGPGGGSAGTLRTVSETQSGLGDVVIGGALNVLPEDAGVGIDVGLRAKLVTADRSNDLLTTGHEDYLAHVDAYGTAGRARLAASIAYTRKGDIDLRDDTGTLTQLDPDDPLSLSLSAAFPAGAPTRYGAGYYWRQKLFDDADPASEATLFAVHRGERGWRLRGYGVFGFSDASPDWGLGASVSRDW